MAFAFRPNDLSLTLGIHTVEGRNQLQQVVLISKLALNGKNTQTLPTAT